MTNFFQQLRRRSSADAGLIDIMSLLVGVLIAGILSGVISVALFKVLPYAQDAAAKESLRAVAVAESTGRIVNGGAYLTLAELEGRDLLHRVEGKDLKIDTAADGESYSACNRSASGSVFEIDHRNTSPRRTATGPCAVETPAVPETAVIEDVGLRGQIAGLLRVAPEGLTKEALAMLNNAQAAQIEWEGVRTAAGFEDATGIDELSVVSSSTLTDTRGFQVVKRISGLYLDFTDYAGTGNVGAIRTISGFDSLEHVDDAVFMGSQTLTSIDAFPSLRSGVIQIIGNPALTRIVGLSAFTSGVLAIDESPALKSIPSFDAMTSGTVSISRTALTDVSGFSALVSADHVAISGNPVLTSVSGFGALTSAGVLIFGADTFTTVAEWRAAIAAY